MCDSYRFWETIHALSNLDIEFYVVYKSSELTFIDNLLGYGFRGQLHALVMFHWRVEIIFSISAHKNLVSGVEMVLLMRVLAVPVSAMVVVTSPG